MEAGFDARQARAAAGKPGGRARAGCGCAAQAGPPAVLLQGIMCSMHANVPLPRPSAEAAGAVAERAFDSVLEAGSVGAGSGGRPTVNVAGCVHMFCSPQS